MPRNQTRRFLNMMQAFSIVDASEGPKISDNIQMVYHVGDMESHLAPVLNSTFYAGGIGNAPVVGEFGMVEVSAPPDSAIEVLFFENLSTIDLNFSVQDSPRITTGSAAFTVDFTNQGTALPVPRSRLFRGSSAVVASGLLIPAAGVKSTAMPLFCDSGRTLNFCGNTNNSAISLNVVWREVAGPVA